jgi:hypothetical protein
VPVWDDRTKDAVADGKLAVLGVIQEQHAERCQLFAQWKGFQWPILQDAINSLGPRAVPIVVAIDERGIVRAVNPQPAEFDMFLVGDGRDDISASPISASPTRTVKRQQLYERALQLADSLPTDAATLLNLGDALMLWGGVQDLDAAVEAYQQAAKLQSDDGPTHFRLGVALRRRYESDSRKPDDFQRAITHWNRALEIDPNQYIWRRRIQQYGPRMTKPYAFYDWITQATTDLESRGEKSLPLRVELTRAELAFPAKRADFAPHSAPEPDPGNKIDQDQQPLVHIVTTVVPPTGQPGSTVRVFLELRPDRQRQVHWTNDAGPTTVWVGRQTSASAARLTPEQSLWRLDNQESIATEETRVVEFEVLLGDDPGRPARLSGYALYYVCEGKFGTCVYRRQDFAIPFELPTGTP